MIYQFTDYQNYNYLQNLNFLQIMKPEDKKNPQPEKQAKAKPEIEQPKLLQQEAEIPSENESIEAQKKLDILLNQINDSIKEYRIKRQQNRRPALLFRILTTGLASVVTILIGMKVSTAYSEWLNNIALIISALMTVVSAWNSFFDYTELWVYYTKAEEDLKILKDEIEFALVGNAHLSLNDVNFFSIRYFEEKKAAVEYLHKVRSDEGQKNSR